MVCDIFARVQRRLVQEDRSELMRLEAQIEADSDALKAQQALAVEGGCRETRVHDLVAASFRRSIASCKASSSVTV